MVLILNYYHDQKKHVHIYIYLYCNLCIPIHYHTHDFSIQFSVRKIKKLNIL